MSVSIKLACVLTLALAGSVSGAHIRGHYMEARTCQVYTGPCFANGEVGLTGKNAVMAWNIAEGSYDGVDLSGMNVVMVVRATDTLGFAGLDDARSVKSLIVVDETATPQQREALIGFAKEQAGKAGREVVSVRNAPIAMDLDIVDLTGRLQAGNCVQLVTRKARPGDCICSNESAYYPPLARVENFVPGVTIEGDVSARKLGSHWSIPDSRTAYMGTFACE